MFGGVRSWRCSGFGGVRGRSRFGDVRGLEVFGDVRRCSGMFGGVRGYLGCGENGNWGVGEYEHRSPLSCGNWGAGGAVRPGCHGGARAGVLRKAECREIGVQGEMSTRWTGVQGFGVPWGAEVPRKEGCGVPGRVGCPRVCVPRGPIPPGVVPCLRWHSHTRVTPKCLPTPCCNRIPVVPPDLPRGLGCSFSRGFFFPQLLPKMSESGLWQQRIVPKKRAWGWGGSCRRDRAGGRSLGE